MSFTDEIQRIMRINFKKLYSTKLENIKEIDNSLDGHHLPKLNQDQRSSLNRLIPLVKEKLSLRLFK